MYIGEAFVGSGAHAAHVNVLIGPREGPVGTAFATALAGPRPGYIPFLVVLQPGVITKPPALFINKADLRGETHETLTWGPAQAGLARGVQEAYGEGILPIEAADRWVIIAAVWINWEADDADAIYANNHQATRQAIEAAMEGKPSPEQIEAVAFPFNPFYTPPEGRESE